MAYDDLIRYAHEILVPLVTTLTGDMSVAVNRLVEYEYLDMAGSGRRDELVKQIVRVSLSLLTGNTRMYLYIYE